jgi:hypothetical protein
MGKCEWVQSTENDVWGNANVFDNREHGATGALARPRETLAFWLLFWREDAPSTKSSDVTIRIETQCDEDHFFRWDSTSTITVS